MKLCTPASLAPGVSVFGMMRSTMASKVLPSSAVKNLGAQSIFGSALQPAHHARNGASGKYPTQQDGGIFYGISSVHFL
jgi:hypothetical protein